MISDSIYECKHHISLSCDPQLELIVCAIIIQFIHTNITCVHVLYINSRYVGCKIEKLCRRSALIGIVAAWKECQPLRLISCKVLVWAVVQRCGKEWVVKIWWVTTRAFFICEVLIWERGVLAIVKSEESTLSASEGLRLDQLHVSTGAYYWIYLGLKSVGSLWKS
jgi:hypothetical protein